MTPKTKEYIFSSLLLLASLIWGTAYTISKDVQEYLCPSYVIAIRFTVASLGLSYYLCKSKQKLTKELWISGAVTGFLLYLAFLTQTTGLNYTTSSKNAILTQSSVIFVPVLLWLLKRGNMGWRQALTAGICFIGLYIVSPPQLDCVNKGDMISLLGGCLYGLHMVVVGYYSDDKGIEVLPMTCLQFAFGAMCAWIYGSATSTFPSYMPNSAWLGLAWLAFASTLIAMTLMNLGIKYVNSAKTSVIQSTESIFGCMFGVIFHKDPLNLSIVIGTLLVVGSVSLTQLLPDPNSTSKNPSSTHSQHSLIANKKRD